jgi:hypothetical protein
MFLGGMLGFAICMKVMFEKVARNDGTVRSDQALLPFLGVMAAACLGAVAGALLIRLVFAVYAPPAVDGSPRHVPGSKGCHHCSPPKSWARAGRRRQVEPAQGIAEDC